VPTASVAKSSASVKLDELVPPVRLVLVAPTLKPSPAPTLFSKATLLPAALTVSPAVDVAPLAPVKATEPLVFTVNP